VTIPAARWAPSRRRVAAVVLCIAWLTLMTAAGAAAARPRPVKIILASEPDGPGGVPIALTLPATAASTKIPVFLRNARGTATPPLRVYVSPLLKDGVKADQGAVTLAFPGSAGGKLTVPARAEVAGTLSVDGLVSPGKYDASVFFGQPGDQHKLATISITKAAPLGVTLEGAAENRLDVTERSAAFGRTLALISTSAVDIENIGISLGQVIGPDGQQVAGTRLRVECQDNATPVTLKALDRVSLRIDIPTPVAGQSQASRTSSRTSVGAWPPGMSQSRGPQRSRLCSRSRRATSSYWIRPRCC
jgi:hypothetical protein